MLRRHSESSDSIVVPQTVEYRNKSGQSGFWLGMAAIVLAAVGLLAFNLRGYVGWHLGAGSNQAEPDRAMLAAELAVRSDLGVGVVPRFAPKDWVKVERDGERYVISGWVEAVPKNGGASISYDYSCSVLRNSAGDWTVSDINIQVQ